MLVFHVLAHKQCGYVRAMCSIVLGILNDVAHLVSLNRADHRGHDPFLFMRLIST